MTHPTTPIDAFPNLSKFSPSLSTEEQQVILRKIIWLTSDTTVLSYLFTPELADWFDERLATDLHINIMTRLAFVESRLMQALNKLEAARKVQDVTKQLELMALSSHAALSKQLVEERRTIQALHDTCTQLRAEITQLRNKRFEAENSAAEAKTAKVKAELDVLQIKQQYDVLEQELESCRRERAIIADAREALRAENDSLRSNLMKAQKRLLELLDAQ